jgi:DNA-damage-inducible protein D
MEDFNKIVLFEQQQIRRIWLNDDWYFVVNDIISLLTDTKNPTNYLKHYVTATRSFPKDGYKL